MESNYCCPSSNFFIGYYHYLPLLYFLYKYEPLVVSLSPGIKRNAEKPSRRAYISLSVLLLQPSLLSNKPFRVANTTTTTPTRTGRDKGGSATESNSENHI